MEVRKWKDQGSLPARFAVFVHVPERPGVVAYVGLVGRATSLRKAQALIRDNERSNRETFGGLIEQVSSKGWRYEIFEASWAKVQ